MIALEVVCLVCGESQIFEDEYMEDCLDAVSQSSWLLHDDSFQGICPDCQMQFVCGERALLQIRTPLERAAYAGRDSDDLDLDDSGVWEGWSQD